MVPLAIVVFFGLFAAVEIYQGVKNVQLPMPLYLVLGILLAVISNSHYGRGETVAGEEAPPTTSIDQASALPEPKQVIGGVD
jgi:hypothetical protein